MAERLFLSLPGDRRPGPETGTTPAMMPPLAVPPDLRGIVGQALSYREDLPTGRAVWERVLPDGAARIVVDLSQPATLPRIAVVGPRTTAELVRLSGRMEGLSLTLAPVAVRALLGVPVGEIAGRTLPLSELWGAPAESLGARLLEAPHERGRVDLLWAALRARLACGDDRAPPALLNAMKGVAERPPERVPDVAASLGLSERRLQQLCRDHFGLSPRSLRQLHRFHRLLRALRSIARPDWAPLALDHGYCDQAHLVREFRRFTGLTPTAYRRRAVSGSSKTTS
ncbi:helix-turn-helix domain-containing protein [Leptolyngbya sp. 15MV]|nr:helix-turn-helix domain-containing protein [Leptolyngbya sp. 15MV]